MFDTQNNAFRKLFEEGKKYINLQIDYAKLTATEKISVIWHVGLFAVILCSLLEPAYIFPLHCLSFRASCNGIVGSYAIVGAVPVTHSDCYPIKKKLILVPITRF